MTTDTPESLLEAVGYDASKLLDHRCRYTGPALGTPDLDAILLVAGQRWCLNKCPNGIPSRVWIAWQALPDEQLPGHALARAIKEATNG